MAPPTNFPGSGPDQTLFMTLFALGVLIALIGYLSGSKSLRLVGILLLFGATGVLMADVLGSPAVLAGLSSAVPAWGRRVFGARAASFPEREVRVE